MPLAHAILGFLEYQPMTGYDLKKYFDQSITHFWSATKSHIYLALEQLEKEGYVEATIIPQEGRPNRKLYQITPDGREELHRWVSTPLPLETTRQAWLIQVFFAHASSNQQIEALFQQRITDLQKAIERVKQAQASIDDNSRQHNLPRLSELWQITLDYGLDYYNAEIAWLEKTLPRIRNLPPLPISQP